jgi:uncharacterized RDD family membrane protein YckC
MSIRPSGGYFFLRALATVIDFAFCGGFFFAYARYFGVETNDGYQVSGCGHVLALIAAWVAFFPLSEGIWGRTLGKWTCDLRVVDLNNRPVTMGQAATRRLLDPIDLFAFFGLVAYIAAKTTPLHQRLGDLVAKTQVVEESSIASTL